MIVEVLRSLVAVLLKYSVASCSSAKFELPVQWFLLTTPSEHLLGSFTVWWTGRNNVYAAGGTNTVNLYEFLPVHRENVNTSRFSAKVKSFPEKLRFSFRQVLEYNLSH